MNRRQRGTIATAVPGMLNPHSWPWEPSSGAGMVMAPNSWNRAGELSDGRSEAEIPPTQ